MGKLLGSTGLLTRRSSLLAWLLKADFGGGDQAAPLSSPLGSPAVEAGELTVTDTGNNLSIVSGAVHFAGYISNTDPVITDTTSKGRRLGRSAIAHWLPSTTTSRMLFTYARNNDGFRASSGSIRPNDLAPIPVSTEHKMALVARAFGTFFVIDGKLAWISNTEQGACKPEFGGYASHISNHDLGFLRVLDLATPFDVPYTPHMTLAGARAASDVFWHPANCRIEWIETTLPNAGLFTLTRFRFTGIGGSNTGWEVRIDDAGNIVLFYFDGATRTTKASGTGVTAGSKILVVANGTTIRVYVGGTQKINYASAVENTNQTLGYIERINTGAAIADLKTHALYPTKNYTDYLPGSRATGETFRHEADGRLSLKVDGVTGGGQVAFRKQDANNYWRLRWNTAGDVLLYEVVDGSGTLRGSASAVLGVNHNITVTFSGTTITIYSNGQQRVNYALATNFATETSGEVVTDSTLSDLVTYPATMPVASATTGLATTALLGGVGVGETFTHEADCLIEWTQAAVPSSNVTVVTFRNETDGNRWQVQVNNAGNLYLQKDVSGTITIRGSVSTIVSAGHRIVISAVGTTIKVYSNNTLRITYSSATNFATETDGTVNGVGTGGEVRDLIAWPSTLTGTAAALLDQASA